MSDRRIDVAAPPKPASAPAIDVSGFLNPPETKSPEPRPAPTPPASAQRQANVRLFVWLPGDLVEPLGGYCATNHLSRGDALVTAFLHHADEIRAVFAGYAETDRERAAAGLPPYRRRYEGPAKRGLVFRVPPQARRLLDDLAAELAVSRSELVTLLIGRLLAPTLTEGT